MTRKFYFSYDIYAEDGNSMLLRNTNNYKGYSQKNGAVSKLT